MKAVSFILLAVMTVLTTACGKDTGISVTLHEKVKPTPATVEQKVLNILKADAQFDAVSHSASSYLIRNNLLGVNATFSAGVQAGTTQVTLTLSQKHSGDKCSTLNFSGSFDNANAQSLLDVSGVGQLMCLDKECSYVLLTIKEGINQVRTSQGAQEAAVPVILVDKSKNRDISQGTYVPTASDSSYFMQFSDDTNIVCNDPADRENVTGIMLPDEFQPDFSYFPLDDYNTWY